MRPYQRKREKKEGLLVPYQEWIALRAPEVGYNAKMLYRELKEKGYRGGYDLTKQYLAPLRLLVFSS